MPTYEYKCSKCAHTFELFQSMTDAPRKRCPECGGKVERLISGGAGLLFKGSGFYITDYRSESYRSAAKADQPAAAKTASGGQEKTRKKAEA
jgi:putative FmdB family regulatory protein